MEAAASRASSITRSHGVLTICVAIPDAASGKDIVGKLHIVELASGVRAGKSQHSTVNLLSSFRYKS